MYMGNVQGPEKVNDSCVKTVHAEMIYRGFSVYFIWPLVDGSTDCSCDY
jgi:hypothetical protein